MMSRPEDKADTQRSMAEKSMRVVDHSRAVPAPQRPGGWEYRTPKMDFPLDPDALAQYGQDGWELVAVVPIPHDPSQAVYHFKRRRA